MLQYLVFRDPVRSAEPTVLERWDKFDVALSGIYANYLTVQEHGADALGWVDPRVHADVPVSMTLHYTGSLDTIEAAGFVTRVQYSGTEADGTVALDRLEDVARLDEVVSLRVGQAPRLRLDASIPEIKADQVWTLNKATGVFSGQTGKGAIVGIIDSGIDFRHNFFLKSASPASTRIQRIWDMGLIKTGAESSPDPTLLGLSAGSPSYGVEYTADQINAVLQKKTGAIPVRHRDCLGHGTHVASTAAGDGRPGHKFVGVAPEADIVMVKMLDVDPNTIPASAPNDRQLKDAVNYILNVAKTKLGNRPVVINCSFGHDDGPNDGLTDEERFIDSTFNSAGRAIVIAAGNTGGGLHHVKIQSSTSASTEVEFELEDKRAASALQRFAACKWVKHNPPLDLTLWYRDIAPKALSFEVVIPGVAAPLVAPALSGAPIVKRFGPGNRQSCQLIHGQSSGGGVKRNSLIVRLTPDDTRYPIGSYKVRIKGNAAVEAHLYFERGRGGTLRLKPKAGGSDQFDIGPNGGAKQAITVAAYGAQGPFIFSLAPFSSRGPLVQYDPSPGARPVPPKPDITAPGMEIDAARSRHREDKPGARFLAAGAETATVEFQGTSMSAPHVTGLAALAFSKKPTLTTDQVRNLIRTHFQAMPLGGTADEWGAGKANAKAVLDNT